MADTGYQLQINRTFQLSVAELFKAWTDENALKQWFHHEPGSITQNAEVDLQVGGKYRIDVDTGQSVFTHTGQYFEIVPDQRISFSWKAPGVPGVTRVTVQMGLKDDETQMKLLHEGFWSPELRDDLIEVWEGNLLELAMLTSANLGASTSAGLRRANSAVTHSRPEFDAGWEMRA